MANEEFESLSKMYDYYIDYIRHENELISQRTGRFIALQSVLIASISISIRYQTQDKPPSATLEQLPHFSDLNIIFVVFVAMVCAIGIFSSAVGWRAISAARESQYRTNASWIENGFYERARLAHLPELMGGGSNRNAGLSVSKAPDRQGGTFSLHLPIIFVIFWMIPLLGLLLLWIYRS